MVKQTFSVLGVRKCGTSTLHSYLQQHPDILMSQPKEPFLFESVQAFERQATKNFERYWDRHFGEWRGQKAVGDANPNKLLYPWVANNVHRALPEGRLIVILRDPVERAFSEWWMEFEAGFEQYAFEEAVKVELREMAEGLDFIGPQGQELYQRRLRAKSNREPLPIRIYLKAGYYHQGLERFLQLFSREQIHLVLLRDVQRNPHKAMRTIFSFLGVDPDVPVHPPSTTEQNRANGHVRRRVTQLARAVGLPLLFHRKTRARLAKTVGKVSGWIDRSRPCLEEPAREMLAQHFREHNTRLEEMTGLDLSDWTSPRNRPAQADGT